jgi:hypothetical protein
MTYFTPDSPWNALTTGPPHARSAEWMAYMAQTTGKYQYPRLTLSAWSMPVYRITAKDPMCGVQVGKVNYSLAIPTSATPMNTSDGAMVTIDELHDECWSLWRAVKKGTRSWTASGIARYGLSTDGYCKTTGNFGHRGVPPYNMAILKNEATTSIDHKLEIFIPGTSNAFIYPMCGGEPRSGKIPEGTVLRIKPDVGLEQLGLTAPALVVARAAQKYGLVVGDTDPNQAAIKCERALINQGLLYAASLAKLPWRYWEIAA